MNMAVLIDFEVSRTDYDCSCSVTKCGAIGLVRQVVYEQPGNLLIVRSEGYTRLFRSTID